jgi:hypothetical protein
MYNIMDKEREKIYDIIKHYCPEVSEPKKLCSTVQDYAEDFAESKVKKLGIAVVSVNGVAVCAIENRLTCPIWNSLDGGCSKCKFTRAN